MQIRVLYFAALADALGVREQTLRLDEPATVADAVAALTALHPGLAAFGPTPGVGLAFAVNLAYAAAGDALTDGDELALLPPVSGG